MNIFSLSAQIEGHQSDVKSICSAGSLGVISGSRDKSVKFWRTNGPNEFLLSSTVQHSSYVNCVAYVPPSEIFNDGLIVSGGRDNVVYVHLPSDPENPLMTLIGHTDNVCTVAVFGSPEEPTIVSGSWDKTAKIWKNGECIQTLTGHEQTVWSVLVLNNGDILTGSADKSIKLWRAGKCVKTITGHSDCVRGLCNYGNDGFVSCANDGSVRVWSYEGDLLQELYGHTSFVYSVAFLPSGEIASVGEDRCLKIWKDGECIQTINHPAQSVWTVSALSNGDVATGSNDGVVRIFTREKERYAPLQVKERFDQSVANFVIPAGQIGDLKKDKLPGEEGLRAPPKHAGEVRMIRVGDKVEAYQFSSTSNQWEKIGDVVDAVGNHKTLYQGKEYDYVFDVDLGDGLPARKLPYNVTENPYMAAQRFIHQEELSQEFLDQIANFIMQNTKGVAIESGPVASDPFTGASRYSGASSNQYGTPTGLGDPFTGSSGYVSQEFRNQMQQSQSSNSLFPQTGFLEIDNANFDLIVSKLLEFNSQMENKLNDDQIGVLKEIVEILKNTSRYHATKFYDRHFDLMSKIIQLPEQNRFPAIDLLRLFVLHPSGVEYFANLPSESFINSISKAGCFESQDQTSKFITNNQLLALRIFANLFKHSAGRSIVLIAKKRMLETTNHFANLGKSNLKLPYVTFLQNLSSLLCENQDNSIANDLLNPLVTILSSETDAEVLYRACIAVGNLITVYPNVRNSFKSKNPHGLLSNSSLSSERVGSVFNALLSIN